MLEKNRRPSRKTTTAKSSITLLRRKYVNSSTYDISYRINDKQIDGECKNCGEKLYIYTLETFTANKEVDHVNRHVFESLAIDVSVLRTEIYEVLNSNSNIEIKSLLNEIINKDKIKDILVAKFSFHRDYVKEDENWPSNNNVLSSQNIIRNEKEKSTATSDLVQINKLKSENNLLRSQLQGKDSRISFLTQFISNISGNKGVNSEQIDFHSNTPNELRQKNHGQGEMNCESHWNVINKKSSLYHNSTRNLKDNLKDNSPQLKNRFDRLESA